MDPTPNLMSGLYAPRKESSRRSRRKKMSIDLRFVVIGIVTFFVLRHVFWSEPAPEPIDPRIKQKEFLPLRNRRIADAFQHAWRGYSTYCMGHDALNPVSNTCKDDLGGWGATAIDALSTAILFEDESAVVDILRLIEMLDFTYLGALNYMAGEEELQLYEITVRHLGAMMSAWDLLNPDVGPYAHVLPYTYENDRLVRSLQTQMVKLGDVLICGFDTPSGIPRNWINPTMCQTDSTTETNTLAGAGSLILEFSRLSDLTQNLTYSVLAVKSEEFLVDPYPSFAQPFPGLLGSKISVEDGSLQNDMGSWGALSDTFYEYLLKAYVYDSDMFSGYMERWQQAADSTIKHLASSAYGRPETTFLPFWEGQKLFKLMDASSWAAGGSFIFGGMLLQNQTLLDFGLSIADTAWHVYAETATGLGGEYVYWTDDCEGWGQHCGPDRSIRIPPETAQFLLRPEVLETWYYAYRATRDPKYREMAWKVFKAMEEFCKTETGYSGISDVTAVDGGVKLDEQDSWLFSQVFKYLWLIHLDEADEHSFPFHVEDSRVEHGRRNTWVMNTHGHPLKVSGKFI